MRRILVILPLLFIVSCITQKELVEVPVEIIKTEYIHDTRVDSIYERDSIDRWIKGDTVFVYKEHTKYKYLKETDTVVRRDTVPKVVKIETVKEVEVNHIKWYQEALMWLGGVAALLLTIYLIFKLKFK